MAIEQLIQQMIKEKHITPRQKWCWRWGKTSQECKALFTRIFMQVDDTIDDFVWLPEYDQIVDWMTNTNDKGLMLMGDCGRGKSLILNYVLPVLFRKEPRMFSAAPRRTRSGSQFPFTGAMSVKLL